MPYAKQYFSAIGSAKGFTAGKLRSEDLKSCNALLVRSTTSVDAHLLRHAPNLQYVATATAGFNHLSLPDLKAANIQWYAAGGCNARAVAEYVLSTLYTLAQQHGFILGTKSVAIVGVGNVGRTLESFLAAIGITAILYDPPRASQEPAFESASFTQVLNADIISLHVPLIRSGQYATEHMFNAKVLQQMRPEQILMNASRGEVLDNQALLQLMQQCKQQMPIVCLDCWEHEPNIERALIEHLSFATAHIAGHSLEGKARGTDMVYQDLCRFLHMAPVHQLNDFLPIFNDNLSDPEILVKTRAHPTVNKSLDQTHQTIVSETIKCMYDIEKDDSFFRRYMAHSASFSEIRSRYPVRREWPAAKITINNERAAQTLQKLGFRLANDSK